LNKIEKIHYELTQKIAKFSIIYQYTEKVTSKLN